MFAGNIVECLEFETTREFLEARVVTLLGPAGRDAVVVVRENNDAGVDRLMTNPRLCFVDSLGTDWRIYEVASVNVPAPRGRNCLIFESAQAVRRVWNYPANWHNLSSDELSALSWNT